MQQVTRALAAFSSKLRFEDLGSALAESAKKYLLDGIGCGLYGSQLPWSRIINRFVKDQQGKREATLWLEKFQGPRVNVALGLGVMIHGFDFDDYHYAKIHPGSSVIPAAITTGEFLEASGKAVLTAMVAGYETMIRVSLATGPNASRLRGWHLTGTTGTFGAAVAAGRLLGLSEDEMVNALGMAGTQSAGLWAFTADGAMSKRFHPGRSSQSGVMAALLAQMGFRGPSQILEAEDGGFCKATSDEVNLSRAIEGLGTRFFSSEVSLKPYACCASSHSAVDGILQLLHQHRFSAADVEKILVKTAKGVQIQCGFNYEPFSAVQAQMSLQYIVAVALLEGKVLVEQFGEEKIRDPKILDLARRVEVVLDGEMEKVYPARYANKVEVILKNGRRFETRVDFAKGSFENPMSFDDVRQKFVSLAGKVIPPKRIDAIMEQVNQFEKLDNVRKLVSLLA